MTENNSASATNIKTILIGTPTLDGKLDAWYTNSLVDTIRIGQANNIFVKPIFLAYESILPMARNEIFRVAQESNVDHLVFIDSDVAWDPIGFFEAVLDPEPVVCLPYPLKSDDGGNYNVNFPSNELLQTNERGLIRIESTGTGFLKIDKPVIQSLWDTNVSVEFRGKTLKAICEYTTAHPSFIGEDINLCRKINELGYKIWVNPKYTCTHIGNRVHIGDFQQYLQALKQATQNVSTSNKKDAPSLFDI